MYYGWTIVGVAFATQFLISGFFFYSFGVVLKDLAAEFGSGRTGVAGVHLVMPWAGALIAPFLGRWAGRGHVRLLMIAGTASTGVGLLLLSQATDLWQLYVITPTFIAFGANTMSGLCVSALVVNWFERKRATALAISQIGASAGGIVMGPVAAAMLAAVGWRETYAIFGGIVLACLPVIAWLTVGRPADRGLEVDGLPAPTPSAAPASSEDAAGPLAPAAFSTRQALRDPNLWLVAFLAGIGFSFSTIVVTHIVAYATDAGVDPLRAATLLSVVAGGAAAGKVVYGGLTDRFGERAGCAVSLATQAVALLALLLVPGTDFLFPVMALMGLAIGGTLPVTAALTARAFGQRDFAPVMGLMAPMLTPFVSVGAPLAGLVYDRTGSYDLAFWAMLGAVACCGLALARVRLPDAHAVS